MSATTTTERARRPSHVPAELVREYDCYDIAGETDVWERFRKLHDWPDIFWTPFHGGHWMVQQYDFLVEIMEDADTFSSRQQCIPAMPGGTLGMVCFDGPKHSAYRKLVRPVVSQPFINRTEKRDRVDAMIRQVAVSLIEGMRGEGGCEFFGDFATKLPVTVILEAILGLPLEDAPFMLDFAETAVRAGGSDPEKHAAAFAEMAQYLLTKIIPDKRANPGDDAVSAFVHGQPEGRPLTDEDIIIQIIAMIMAGMDTVTAALTFVAWHLAEHPGHRRRLIDDPDITLEAVDEYMRRFAIANMARTVARDVEFHGVQFAEGDVVYVPAAAASVDDRRYPNAMEVDFDREDKQHITFQRGPHQCLGKHLARREIAIFLQEWLTRIPDFEVKPGTQIQMMTGITNRIVELPLVWDVPTATNGAGA